MRLYKTQYEWSIDRELLEDKQKIQPETSVIKVKLLY